jgi:hypothetical protein
VYVVPGLERGCAWKGNMAVEAWRKGRTTDEEGHVFHFGPWDSTPDKHCPKKGKTPRGMR